jgi:lipopolysaccharide heptosyltransferase II
VLTALRQRFPAAHITWIVNRGYQPLLEGHPHLDATLAFDRGASHHGLLHAASSYARFFTDLRRRRFDLAIDLQGLFRSGLMTLATGARQRLGLATAREGARWFYTHTVRVPDAGNLHAVDRYWLAAEALGAGSEPKTFLVPIADAERVWADSQMALSPRPWLFVGVGARWMTKRWPPEHFARLLRQAQAHFGGTVALVGGRDEIALARATAEGLSGPVVDFTGRTSLPQLAALLRLADVMIANDTGPLHLAAALGRPVVAPYTCTSIRRTGPYGYPENGVQTRVWCQGSYVKRCDRLDCMKELTPDRLWPILRGVLQQCQSSLSA